MYLMAVKGLFTLFISLSLGYVLCILAKKQEGLLKAVGYTFGIAIIVLSLLTGLMATWGKCGMMGKMGGMMGGKGPYPMMKMHK